MHRFATNAIFFLSFKKYRNKAEIIYWFRQDYAVLQLEMIYGEAPEFEVIMSEMIELTEFLKNYNELDDSD